MLVYRIAGWNQHFENNRTRELKKLDWVPMPNKQDGDGYTELLSHKDGAAHFGAWVAIVQVASKCDPRGTLLRDGAGGVRLAHDAASIARITRLSAAAIENAIRRLVVIGWIEAIYMDAKGLEEIPQDDAALEPQDAAASRAREKGREGKGIEGNGTEGTTLRGEPRAEELGFAEFWVAYPKKREKPKARAAWISSAKTRPPLDQLLAALERAKASAKWNENDGQFIVYPERWLKRGCWDDVLEVDLAPAAGPEVIEVWQRHLKARQRYCESKARPCVSPDLTPALAALIQAAIKSHGKAKALAAGVGLFYSEFHIGKNEQQREYLEPDRPWSANGTTSNVEKFAQLYEETEALFAATAG